MRLKSEPSWSVVVTSFFLQQFPSKVSRDLNLHRGKHFRTLRGQCHANQTNSNPVANEGSTRRHPGSRNSTDGGWCIGAFGAIPKEVSDLHWHCPHARCVVTRLEPYLFQIFLLRRSRLLLRLTKQLPFDSSGHQRAACFVFELGSGKNSLWRTLQPTFAVRREEVTTNVMVRDMDLAFSRRARYASSGSGGERSLSFRACPVGCGHNSGQ